MTELYYAWTGKPIPPAEYMLLSLRRAHFVDLQRHGRGDSGIFWLSLRPRDENDGWWFWVGHNQSAAELIRQAFQTVV